MKGIIVGVIALCIFAVSRVDSALRFNNHKEPQFVTQEFQNMDRVKEDKIQFAGRAPNAGDEGRLWVDYAASKLYVRHPNTGTWTAI